jgi:hypothetical protein
VGIPCSVPGCTEDGTRWAHVQQRTGTTRSYSVGGDTSLNVAVREVVVTVPSWMCDVHAKNAQSLGYLVQPPFFPTVAVSDGAESCNLGATVP